MHEKERVNLCVREITCVIEERDYICLCVKKERVCVCVSESKSVWKTEYM